MSIIWFLIFLNGILSETTAINNDGLEITPLQTEILTLSKVVLDGNCGYRECNLGNLATDSMVYSYAIKFTGTDWTDSPIAFMAAGDIQASVNAGNISISDLEEIFGNGGKLLIVPVTGAEILLALEQSVSRYNNDTGSNEFLQMSGVQVVYDLSKDSGHRVQSAKLRCSSCDVPKYYDLQANTVYKIIITESMVFGENIFTMLSKPDQVVIEVNYLEVIEDYIKRLNPIHPITEWRVQFFSATGNAHAIHTKIIYTLFSVLFSLFTFKLFK